MLTATSASRGTIRAGQFSQIPTVIQSGGDDDMWTFDRYERWIAQKSDWVAPAEERASVGEFQEPLAAPRPPSPKPSTPPPVQAFDLEIDEDSDLQEIARKIDEGD